jgi:hypothetical protein
VAARVAAAAKAAGERLDFGYLLPRVALALAAVVVVDGGRRKAAARSSTQKQKPKTRRLR